MLFTKKIAVFLILQLTTVVSGGLIGTPVILGQSKFFTRILHRYHIVGNRTPMGQSITINK